MKELARVRKAIAGAVLAAGPMLLAALTDNTPAGSGVAQSEWIAVAVTFLVAFSGVWAIPNRPQETLAVEIVNDEA